jgi:hypothetical protein
MLPDLKRITSPPIVSSLPFKKTLLHSQRIVPGKHITFQARIFCFVGQRGARRETPRAKSMSVSGLKLGPDVSEWHLKTTISRY